MTGIRTSPAKALGEVRERPNRTHCQPEQATRFHPMQSAETVLIWDRVQCFPAVTSVSPEFMDRIMDNRLGQ
jgi:hypothetical protein